MHYTIHNASPLPDLPPLPPLPADMSGKYSLKWYLVTYSQTITWSLWNLKQELSETIMILNCNSSS